MTFDPPQTRPQPTPEAGAGPPREKVRIRFRKDGDLRLISHHDLMKCFERMFRRAALPVVFTQVFNPKPRMVFPLSLALGIVGCQEVVELELAARLTPEEIHHALARQAPPGLHLQSVELIDRRLTGQVQRVCYRLEVPPARHQGLRERIAALLGSAECWVERTRPQPRRLNVRPWLRDLTLSAGGLLLDVHVTPAGTVRPEEILELLGLGDLPDAGAVLERTVLELQDETPSSGPAPPPVEARPEPVEKTAREPSSRPTALIPGPLSFDS
jgi:radical SAM-linked protein